MLAHRCGREHAYDVPQCNSFYRMLAHKLADYYLLGHVVDATVSSVRLYKTQNCRLYVLIQPQGSSFLTS